MHSNTLHLPSHPSFSLHTYLIINEFKVPFWSVFLDYSTITLKGAQSTRLITKHCHRVQRCNNQEPGLGTNLDSGNSMEFKENAGRSTFLLLSALSFTLLPRQSSLITCLALITTKRIIILLNFFKVSHFSSTTGSEREPQRAPVIPNVINGNLAPPPMMWIQFCELETTRCHS